MDPGLTGVGTADSLDDFDFDNDSVFNAEGEFQFGE